MPSVLSTVDTARLVGTPLASSDLDFLCALMGDPRVGETLGGVRDRAQVEAFLRDHEKHWQRHGYGYWTWRERASGEPVARGGLGNFTVEGEPVVELAWAVLPERWGQGIATELGAASMRAAAQLGMTRVVACTLVGNRASRRVMEKLGMRYDRDFEKRPWGTHALYVADLDAAGGDG
jgi:[ribosomal protein S5]-alanine N-acetyltransferase